jgi:hypothetical protein
MPRFDPTDFSRLLARLTPQELRKVEGMVAEARERAEAVLEIDARAEAGGPAASCPRCGDDKRIRWARTRTGAQRWRLAGLGEEASCGDGPRRSPGLRGHRGRGPDGHLRRPAARDGAGCGSLHRRPRDL